MKTLSDSKTTIRELRERVGEFMEARDSGRYENLRDIATAISVQASKLLELCQCSNRCGLSAVTDDPDTFAMIRGELAEVIMYCLSLADVANVDVARAITETIEEHGERHRIEQIRSRYTKSGERQNEQRQRSPGPDVLDKEETCIGRCKHALLHGGGDYYCFVTKSRLQPNSVIWPCRSYVGKGERTGRVSCPDCDSDLVERISEKRFRCGICGRVFS